MHTAYDPTSVSATVVAQLSDGEKEELSFLRVAHMPLQGSIARVVAEKKAIIRKEKEQSN